MGERIRTIMRRTAKEMRGKLTPNVILKKSTQVNRQLDKLDVYRHAKNVALYKAIMGEVDLDSIWKTAPYQGKACYFPKLEDDRLIFLPATPKTKFTENHYGILEPDVDKGMAISPEKLDIVLMPLVVFDPFCQRLGMGKGYYDRTFAEVTRKSKKDVFLVGVAYEFQKQPVLPTGSWDVPLDGVVTEKNIYWSSLR